MVLGGTALATGFFGLREVGVDNPYGEVGAATQQAGSESLLIALQGYPDSSEYKATAEWMAFLAGYDQDRALFRAAQENPPELDARYALYNVYTQEMADKLDEITEKYGLTLHCRMVTCPDVASLYASCGVDGFIRGDYKVSGFAYDDGSFLFNGSDASEDGLGARVPVWPLYEGCVFRGGPQRRGRGPVRRLGICDRGRGLCLPISGPGEMRPHGRICGIVYLCKRSGRVGNRRPGRGPR